MPASSLELLLIALSVLGLGHLVAWKDVAAHREENAALAGVLSSWTRFADPTLLASSEAPTCRRVLHLAAREGYAGALDPRRAFEHLVTRLQGSAERGHALARELAALEREVAGLDAEIRRVGERVEARAGALRLASRRLDRALARRAAGQKAG